MESHSSTNIKVGIFLAIGIIVILASIFFLGADKALFRSYVRLNAQFEQTQGLAQGSVVSLSGITVGNVESITFSSEKNLLNVRMRIDAEFFDRIRQGSEVEIRTQGALGDKFIFIIPGDASGAPLKENDVLPVARATDLFGVISERGGESSKIFDIINELHITVKTLNSGNRLNTTLNNLEKASGHLTATGKQAEVFMNKMTESNGPEKMRHSIEKLDSILSKIDRGEGSLGALINDPSIHNQLKSMLGGSPRKNSIKSLIRTSIEKSEE